MRRIPFSVVAILISPLLCDGPIHAAQSKLSCGVTCLLDLCSMMGRPLSDADQLKLAQKYPEPVISLQAVTEAAAAHGIELKGVTASLEELLELNRPSLVHLDNPSHLALLLDASGPNVRLVDGGKVLVLARKDVFDRFTGAALVLPDSEQDAPRVRFDEPHYEFTVQGADEKVERVFRFVNVGGQPLEVSVSAKSCGCLTTAPSGEPVPPGGAAEVKVELHVRGMGQVQETVTLKTNDPLRARMPLTLRGQVPVPVDIRPPRLIIRAEKGAAVEDTVRVFAPLRLQVLEGATDVPFVRVVEIGERQEHKRGQMLWPVMLRMEATAPVGPFAGTLTLTTDDEKLPTLKVPIDGLVRGDLEVEGGSVFFGFVKPGGKAQQELVIRSGHDRKFQVQSASCEDSRVRVGKPQRVGEGAWKVPVALDTSRPGFVDAKVTVKTDVEREQTIEVVVTACIAE